MAKELFWGCFWWKRAWYWPNAVGQRAEGRWGAAHDNAGTLGALAAIWCAFDVVALVVEVKVARDRRAVLQNFHLSLVLLHPSQAVTWNIRDCPSHCTVCMFLWAGWDKYHCFLPSCISVQASVWGVNQGVYPVSSSFVSFSSLLHHTPQSLPAFSFTCKDQQKPLRIFPEQAQLMAL